MFTSHILDSRIIWPSQLLEYPLFWECQASLQSIKEARGDSGDTTLACFIVLPLESRGVWTSCRSPTSEPWSMLHNLASEWLQKAHNSRWLQNNAALAMSKCPPCDLWGIAKGIAGCSLAVQDGTLTEQDGGVAVKNCSIAIQDRTVASTTHGVPTGPSRSRQVTWHMQAKRLWRLHQIAASSSKM